MKNIALLMSILTFVQTSCNEPIKAEKQLVVKKDTIKPIEKTKVIKEYDNDGNLISVDSSYYYFYSNIKNDTLLEKEIFDKFKHDYKLHFQSFDTIFKNGFKIISPFDNNDFYTKDFYQNYYKFQNKDIERIFKEMDSIKNLFYNKQKTTINKT